MKSNLLKKVFSRVSIVFLALCTSSFSSMATILTPNPGESNESHWDAILGANSFDTYALYMRLIPSILLLIGSAWAVNGLFRAAFIKESISKIEFVTYSGRLMIILTISIALIFT